MPAHAGNGRLVTALEDPGPMHQLGRADEVAKVRCACPNMIEKTRKMKKQKRGVLPCALTTTRPCEQMRVNDNFMTDHAA